MGSKLIWIAAAFAYGAVCAAIYTFICRQSRKRRLALRAGVSFVAYSCIGLAVAYCLWRLFAI